jgi:predicted DNA-binding transcriptional regulator AlpA
MSETVTPGKLIGKREVAAKINDCSAKTIDRLVARGILPPPMKLSDAKFAPCLWVEEEVDEILRERVAAALVRAAALKQELVKEVTTAAAGSTAA